MNYPFKCTALHCIVRINDLVQRKIYNTWLHCTPFKWWMIVTCVPSNDYKRPGSTGLEDLGLRSSRPKIERPIVATKLKMFKTWKRLPPPSIFTTCPKIKLKKCDMWHITCDTWNVACDMCHVTGGGGWTFSKNNKSLAHTVWLWRCLKILEQNNDLLNK